jgi:hypothetical protein
MTGRDPSFACGLGAATATVADGKSQAHSHTPPRPRIARGLPRGMQRGPDTGARLPGCPARRAGRQWARAATPERLMAGARALDVTLMQITDAGGKALAGTG